MVLFYAEENWRGKHAWEKYKREREAKGDSFEWASVVPPPVPDDQNFAMTPLFAELFPKRPEHPRLEAVKLPECPEAAGNWYEGRVENLAAWRACFTNDDLLAALTRYEPILQEINQATRRLYSRFPVRYQDNFTARLPHLSPLRDLAKLYRLYALAELSARRPDAACGDVQMCLRLADTIRDEPLLIPFMVRVAMVGIASQVVWQGLVEHQWNEGQLADLQAKFQRVDPLAGFAGAIHGERLLSYHTINSLRKDPSGFFELMWAADRFPSGKWSWLDRMIPSGWFCQNQLATDRFYTLIFLPTVDFEHQQVSPKTLIAAVGSFKDTRRSPYNNLCKMLVPPMAAATRKAVFFQTDVQQVVAACAIERYRLAHEKLPDALDALVPQFLSRVPHDVIDGQPLRYRRIGPDQFVLYSIGWNERDDGGQIAWTKDKPPRQDQERGDWVWFSQPQPATSEQK